MLPSDLAATFLVMSLPTAYLTTTRNLEALLAAVRNAKAPSKFTQRFLEELEFKSTNDRLYINVFKALGLLSEDGTPTTRYFEFMDQTQSGRVLAEAIEDAYADLFQIRRDAQKMERAELRGKIKTLTQGQVSDNVVDRMAMTFLALAEQAEWNAPKPSAVDGTSNEGDDNPIGPADANSAGKPEDPESNDLPLGPQANGSVKLGGFVYNVELHLPESRDPAVYESLFRALKSHLLS
jgi:hypothetical protein